MRRREFIRLVGCVTATWPLAARAQQPAPGKWRIGVLGQKQRQDELRLGLRELGYIQGENLDIEARSNQRADQLASFAVELVSLKPNVIFTAGTQATQAVQQATQSIPIVMLASDPVGNHLITSLARPGGNVTGVSLLSSELSGKRIEMLRTVTGELSLLAVLWNPDDPPAAIALRETQEAAEAMRLQMAAFQARSADSLTSVFQMIAQAGSKAIVILNSPLMSVQVARIAELALGLKLPSIYTNDAFPKAGGLMSYGPNFDSLARRAAIYVDRIFKGEKPGDLPVEQPSKFELVINLKTAKALGLDVPPSVLGLADVVIE